MHPLFQEWKELRNVKSAAEVHNALNTTDKFSAMIRKMRTHWWPQGRGINTVAFIKERTEGTDDVRMCVRADVRAIALVCPLSWL